MSEPSPPDFALHPQLAADTFLVAELPLSCMLLMNDSRYPWCILVPRRTGVREIHELSDADQQQLLRESSRLGRAMVAAFGGDKLNVAALGNVVPQLHVHHIVRFQTDAAWPAPVWGKFPAMPYDDDQRAATIARLKARLYLHD